MTRSFTALLTIACVAGCAEPAPRPPGWTLVGAYDTSATRAWELGLPEEDQTKFEYLWVDAAGMSSSCGPSKAPDGFGVFEAEAIANRHLPTLALLMKRTPGTPALHPGNVRVGLGREKPEFFLQPAVQPRYLSITIDGKADIRYKQQVRTQLQMELCMEHKTGRGWIGGTGETIRQAFLLDPPTIGEKDGKPIVASPDRRYFGGQRDPVPALLGPPDACLVRKEGLDAAEASGGKGESSLNLVPSDVWGASVRWCTITEAGGALYNGPTTIPLTLSETPAGKGERAKPKWRGLHVDLGAGEQDADISLAVKLDGEVLIPDGSRLFSKSEETGDLGIQDILSKVPHTYPTVGTAKDEAEYTVLLVPNWQVVEGIRRLHAGKVEEPMPTAGTGVMDGVGWLLDHPEFLFVQVPQSWDEPVSKSDEDWLNAAAVTHGGPLGLWAWGYTTGMLSGRSPIALAGPRVPGWEQVMLAQRSANQGIFFAASAMLFTIVWVGRGRLRDLFVAVPEERVDFWPGPPKDGKKEEEAPPPMEGMGGEEGA